MLQFTEKTVYKLNVAFIFKLQQSLYIRPYGRTGVGKLYDDDDDDDDDDDESLYFKTI